jgi:hypothetical protein
MLGLGFNLGLGLRLSAAGEGEGTSAGSTAVSSKRPVLPYAEYPPPCGPSAVPAPRTET